MIAHGSITKPAGLLFYVTALDADEDFWLERAEPERLPQDPAEAERDVAYVATNLWHAIRRSQEKRGEIRAMEPLA